MRLICLSAAASPPEPVSPGAATVPAPEQLPDDPATLKRRIVELVTTLHERERDLEQARQRIHLLLRRLYGPRSERVYPDQLLLFAEEVEGPHTESSALSEPPASNDSERPAPKRRCRPHGRRRLPDNLPRRPMHHELAEAERLCRCGRMRIDIGTEVSEQLDWQPACYFVWQHLTHKYLCPHCASQRGAAAAALTEEAPVNETAPTDPAAGSLPTVAAAPAADAAPPVGPAIVSASKPARPIAKGLPGPGLLAHIIVSKYFDHLPLYRQAKIFERQGLVLNRSTTCDGMAACADVLRPL